MPESKIVTISKPVTCTKCKVIIEAGKQAVKDRRDKAGYHTQPDDSGKKPQYHRGTLKKAYYYHTQCEEK